MMTAGRRPSSARERRREARRNASNRESALIRRTISHVFERAGARQVDDAAALPDALMVMARFTGAVLPEPTDDRSAIPGVPGASMIEDAFALEDYFAAPPDLPVLLAQARELLERADRWTEQDDSAQMRDDARRGALTLGYARLCRIGLWPARFQVDLSTKSAAESLIASRRGDPDHLRPLVEIALDVGRRITRQSNRFLSVSGIEL